MHYSFKIHNIKAYDLNLKKENHGTNNINIDPYVKIYFDDLKKYKTETINKTITPFFKFEQSVHLPIMKAEELTKRTFQLECFDSCFGGDNLIGSCSVDFFTVLNGPVRHKLVLRNKGVANGTIEFDLEMSEFVDTKLTFRNLKTSYYAGALPQSSLDQSTEKYLFYYILNQSKLQKITKTLKTKKSKNLVWEDVDQIIYTTGLRELLTCPIVFNVLQYKNYNGETDPSLGQITITLGSIVFDTKTISGPAYAGVEQKSITFVEPIIHQNQVVGVMEGEIYFDNVSPNIQLIDCIHTETGIQSFNDQINNNNNNNIKPILQAQPQQIPQTYAPQQQQQFTQQQSPPQTYAPQQPISQSPPKQQQQPFAPQQTPQPYAPQAVQQPQVQQQSQKFQGVEFTDARLPLGWVVRIDPNTNKQYYVDHSTKTTHWTLPANIAAAFNVTPTPTTTAATPVKPVTPITPVQPMLQPQGYVYPPTLQPQQAGYVYPQQQAGYVYPQYYQQQYPATYMMSYPSSGGHCHGHHC